MSSLKRPKVLLIGPMYHKDGEQLLAAYTDVQVMPDVTDERLGVAIRDASAAYVLYPSRLTAEVIREGQRLLVISASGRGTDAIDLRAATESGIAVVNNPGLGTIPVSEHTVALMLDLLKQITWSDARVRRGAGWADRQHSSRTELEGRTLGIIGLGNIGAEVARKCITAFRVRVLVYDPYIPPGKAEGIGAARVEHLSALLGAADIVSLHPELTAETRGMIGENELRQMRTDAFLINTSRGPVVNEGALVRALREGWIAGAAIDVFDPEPPPPGSPLYGLDNLILSPHVGGITKEARRHLALSAATQILQVLRGERPPNLINPEVWGQVAARVAAAGLMAPPAQS